MEIAKEIRNVMLSKYNLVIENSDSDILILFNHYKDSLPLGSIPFTQDDLIDFTAAKLTLNHDWGIPL